MPENPRLEELRRRVQADPASIAFAALAEEFRRMGRYDEAVETCRQGLQRHPAYLSARVTLGRALIETADYDAARTELQLVLESAPENLAALRGLEQISERLGHSNVMDPKLAEFLHSHPPIHAAPPTPIPVVESPFVVPEAPAPAVASDLDLNLSPPVTAFEPEVDLQLDQEAVTFESSPQEPAAAQPDSVAAWLSSLSLPSTKAPEPAPIAVEASASEPIAITFDPMPFASQEPIAIEAALAVELAPTASVEPESESVLEAEPELEPLAVAEPPADGSLLSDPVVAASLARLERFLEAIHSTRA
jgi:hypothetical protein